MRAAENLKRFSTHDHTRQLTPAPCSDAWIDYASPETGQLHGVGKSHNGGPFVGDSVHRPMSNAAAFCVDDVRNGLPSRAPAETVWGPSPGTVNVTTTIHRQSQLRAVASMSKFSSSSWVTYTGFAPMACPPRRSK